MKVKHSTFLEQRTFSSCFSSSSSSSRPLMNNQDTPYILLLQQAVGLQSRGRLTGGPSVSSVSHLGKKGTEYVPPWPWENHGCVQDLSGIPAGVFSASPADLLCSGETQELNDGLPEPSFTLVLSSDWCQITIHLIMTSFLWSGGLLLV